LEDKLMKPIFALGLPHGLEWFWIALIVVLLFGADKLPKLARGLGKSLGEFKKAKDEFEKEIHSAANDTDETKALAEKNNPTIMAPTPTTPASAVPREDGLTKKT
jgi:TatA/E family protein of Tat protein translocase